MKFLMFNKMLPKKINFAEMKHTHPEHGLSYCDYIIKVNEHDYILEKAYYHEQTGHIAKWYITNMTSYYDVYVCNFDMNGVKHGLELERGPRMYEELWYINWQHGALVHIELSKEFRSGQTPSLLPKEVLPTEIKNKINEVFNV